MEGYQDEQDIEEYEEQMANQGFEDPEDVDIYGGSEPKPLGGLYALFGDVIERRNPTRVSNLSISELGDLGITVRDSFRIALIGKTFHHLKFAKFFVDQAEIVTATAMSKKGWLAELFVTSKKFASRETAQKVGVPENERKWLFGKKKK
ncbi:MAG: hypothetical protein ACP5D2_02385 [Candidatus Nanoarchaeia archaeon]